MRIVLIFVLIAGFLQSLAQTVRTDQVIAVEKSPLLKSVNTLEARFAASVTEGLVPLKVQFTDQSTGSPVSWKWQFGDGDSSLLQNPSHTYRTVGAYTVRLTISDGKNGFTLEKKDYIRANLSLNACDTMHFPLPEPLTNYTIPGKGYVSGNNAYGDKAICDYFDNLQSLAVTGVLFEFSTARLVAGTDEKIPVCLWKHDNSTGKPGMLIYSDTMMLSKCANDVASRHYTSVVFSAPVQIDGSFYMGIMLPQKAGDTLSLWSTGITKIPVNTGWVMTTDGIWTSAKELWPAIGEQPFIISNAIYPKVCRVDGIADDKVSRSLRIFPNPAADKLYVTTAGSLQKPGANYQVCDMTGRMLLEGRLGSERPVVDVSSLKPGIYVLLSGDNKLLWMAKFIKQ